MLEALITSKTRIKLLIKLFLNANSTAYLRGLEDEFGESTNGIRMELNRFEQAGLICSALDGNKKVYRANVKHPLFGDIHNILLKNFGFDTIIDHVVACLGDLNKVFITGEFAHGHDAGQIDLIFVGEAISKDYLSQLVKKAESMISRTIRFLLMDNADFEQCSKSRSPEDLLLLWEKDR